MFFQRHGDVGPAGSSGSGTGLPTLYRDGFFWYRNGSDPANRVDIYSGKCRSDDDTDDIISPNWSPLTKRLDANWASGHNAGGLDTGSRQTNTWYWIWAIKRTDTGNVDILFSTSNTSPTMPANYNKKRCIGAIRTGSSNLQSIDVRSVFGQNGLYVRYLNPADNGLDVDVTNLGTTATNYTLTNVPISGNTRYLSIAFDANVSVVHSSASPQVYISNPDHADATPSLSASPLATVRPYGNSIASVNQVMLLANRNGQITAKSASTSTTFKVQVLGWYWPRI
jgi:hypothetical protein